MKQETEICPCCGQKIAEYRVGLSPLMLRSLVKFRTAVVEKGVNSVHLLKDFENKPYELTRHEWNNFTRLRFHALAVKDKGNPGHWLLTRRGADFLNGKIKVPKYVWVRNNVVTEHSEELIGLSDVLGSQPYVEKLEDIVYRSFEPKELKLF